MLQPLINKEAAQRYELILEGPIIIVEYKETATHIYWLHTEVPENQEGKGMATAIIEKVFLDIEYRVLRL